MTPLKEQIIKEARDDVIERRFLGQTYAQRLRCFIFIEKWINIALDRQLEEIRKEIVNSPNNFGLIDKKGKGGALLIQDILEILK